MKEKNWKVALSEARTLKKKGIEMLYDRVKLLVDVFNDAAFIAQCEEDGTEPFDILDDALSDIGHGFRTMKAVMNEYPNKTDWVRHDLRNLMAMAVEKHRKASDPKDRVDWKALAERYKAECEVLRNEIESMRKTLEVIATARCA